MSQVPQDVLIVGAGAAGMAAAVRAHEAGARVTIIDDNPGLGGQIWRGGERTRHNRQSARWFSRFRAAAVPIIRSTQVISANSNRRTLLLETPEEALEMSFRKLILATGSREVFLPFPGWTLPGIMGVGGLQALAKSGLPIAGKSVVVAGSGPLLLALAAYLRTHGARVKLIAEQAGKGAVARFAFRLLRHPEKIAQAVALQSSLLGIPYRQGCWVEAAEGNGRVERLRLRQGRKTWTEECDYAAVGYGLIPSSELAALLKCQLSGQAVVVDERQQTSVEGIFCAGECTGIGGVDLALIEGEIAGYAAAGQFDRARALFAKRDKARRFSRALHSAFSLRPELKQLPQADTIVCRCEDITFGKLEKIPSFRAAKLYTRCGMGPCQGRVCGPATAFLFGWSADSIRPPIFPARVGTLT